MFGPPQFPDENAERLSWFSRLYSYFKDKLAGGEIIGRLFTSTASATVANTTDETSIIGTGIGNKTLPAHFFSVGRTILIRVRGILSDTGTPTLNVKAKLGATTLISTGAIALIGTISDDYFEVDVEMVCRSVGSSGTVMASGEFTYDNSNQTGVLEGMSATAATTIDTTAAQAIDITVTWGAANASNSITGQLCEIDVIN